MHFADDACGIVDLEGELDKDGKFDKQKTQYVRSEGSDKIVDAVKRGIEAANDTGVFYYLSSLGAKKVNLILGQNDVNIYGTINAEFASAEKAKTVASMLNTFK